MANEKLLKLIQQGRSKFMKWRAKHPKAILDLLDADLSGIDLRSANLRRGDLIGVTLTDANLSNAVLTGTDLTRSKLVGINLRKADLSQALLAFADLSRADLTAANLQGADLSKTVLKEANLTDARLDGAKLADADLTQAKLDGASLRQADLGNARLTKATLQHADLTEANLTAVRFDEADLTDASLNRATVKSAQFHQSTFGWTSMGGVDLSASLGVDTIIHAAPSSLGVDSLLSSHGTLPPEFLLGCGIPLNLAATSTQSKPSPVCFLSFSEQDRAIAELLQRSLATEGIHCWLNGKPLEEQEGMPNLFQRGSKLWDKWLLLASSNSLRSWWVDDEIAAALQREDNLSTHKGDMHEVLIPVIVDGYISGGNWQGVQDKRIYDRLTIDFSRCRRDKERFSAEIEKVVQAVKGESDTSQGKKKRK